MHTHKLQRNNNDNNSVTCLLAHWHLHLFYFRVHTHVIPMRLFCCHPRPLLSFHHLTVVPLLFLLRCLLLYSIAPSTSLHFTLCTQHTVAAPLSPTQATTCTASFFLTRAFSRLFASPNVFMPHSTPSVVCFGHPLLDMMADVDADFLKEFGIESGSVNLATPAQDPLFPRLLERGGVEYTPGGASMNTARAMAWIRPKAHVYFVGALGKDRFAEILRGSLAKGGVRQLFEECETKPTGTCAGLVYKKERSLLTKLGAAVELSMEHMYEDTVQSAIAEAQLFYAEGFFLNTASSPDNLLSVALHAHRHNKIFTLNLSAPYISMAFHTHLKILMPHVDMLFGSDDDILAFAKVSWAKDFARLDALENDSENDVNGKLSQEKRELLIAALRRICALPTVTAGRPRLVICTCGADNTLVASGGTVRSYEVPSMPSDEIVDLNGAGDAFVGGFLSQYLTYPDESLCAQVGHESAQNCIRHNGAGVGGAPPVLRTLGVSEVCSDGVPVLITSPKAMVAAS